MDQETTSHEQDLREAFEQTAATVAVVGQGYVGLPLALAFARAGFETFGIDVDTERVARLNDGTSYIEDVDDAAVREVVESGNYRATDDYAAVGEAEAVSICVPTPLRKTRDPDVSYIQSAAESLAPELRGPTLVILESTTYPGSTEEILVPILVDKNGGSHALGENLFVAFSPERVDPGNETYHIGNTPKVVGGVDESSTELAEALYGQMIEQVHTVPGATEAEMAKLLENTFRAVNIGLVNEMALMCDRMQIDTWEVIEAAATKPFGFMAFYPGPGIGGHCIPNDPTYLSWKAKSYGFHHRFIELATDINTDMPRFVADRAVEVLNDHGKPMRGAEVLLVGVAYKPDVSDTRESPALDIWRLLEGKGAELSYHDPHVESLEEVGGGESVELSDERLERADLVVVCTDHSGVEYGRVAGLADAVLDTRNCVPRGEGVERI
jgi:UDP-N-acetyl-D-glucosamine dehydrogenase